MTEQQRNDYRHKYFAKFCRMNRLPVHAIKYLKKCRSDEEVAAAEAALLQQVAGSR